MMAGGRLGLVRAPFPDGGRARCAVGTPTRDVLLPGPGIATATPGDTMCYVPYRWLPFIIVLSGALPVRADETVSLTLPGAVTRARAVNPDLRALRARLAQQSAGVRVALAQVLPTLSVTGTYLRNDQNVEAAGRAVSRLDELSLVGGMRAGLFRPAALGDWLAVDAELDAAVEAAAYEADAVAFLVVELYISALRSAARHEWASTAAERRGAFLRAARARLEHGTTDRSEVQRAELSLADARLELEAARADEAAALVALAAVLELPPEPGTLRLTGDTSPPLPQQTSTAAWDPSGRSDVQAIRMLLEERDDLARTFTWLRFLPAVDLAATFAQEEDSFSNPDGFTWRIELQATWLLYDGGARYGALDLEAATRDLHRAQLAGLDAETRGEVSTAAIRIEQLERQLATARESLDTARQYREDAGRRLDAGVATLLDVLDAEAQLSAVEVLTATLVHDLDLARWRSIHAKGELGRALP